MEEQMLGSIRAACEWYASNGTTFGTVFAILAAISLWFGSRATDDDRALIRKEVQSGFNEAATDRAAIREEVQSGFNEAAGDRASLRTDVQSVQSGVNAILERLPPRIASEVDAPTVGESAPETLAAYAPVPPPADIETAEAPLVLGMTPDPAPGQDAPTEPEQKDQPSDDRSDR
jgi:hypothetical protein